MFNLFPKFRRRFFLLAAVFLGCTALLVTLKPGFNLVALVLLVVSGVALLALMEYMNAANAHNQQLNQLYNQLDVEGFLKDYEPHLNAKLGQNLALMVRIHLSNAYAAQGRFEDSQKVLSSIQIKDSGKRENALISHFAVESNLCYCAEQMNDIPTAKKHLDTLLGLKKELEAIQETKPMKKRVAFNTQLNEQCMDFLTTGHADVNVLKTQVQQNNTQQLHRITTSLWIARAYLAQNNKHEAVNILRQIVKFTPSLYPVQVASKMLSELPQDPEDEKNSKAENKKKKA